MAKLRNKYRYGKIAINSFLFFADFVVFVLLIFYSVLSLPDVQTYIAKELSSSLSESKGVVVDIEKFHFYPLKHAELKNVYVEDDRGDTLIFLETLKTTFSWSLLSGKKIKLNDIELESGVVNFIKYKDGTTNMSVLNRLFKSDQKKQPPTISISGVELNDIRFTYVDSLKYVEKNIGVNYFDLDIKNISLLSENFLFENGIISTQIKHLSCIEKSGFEIEQMKTNYLLDSKQMFFGRTAIQTPQSVVYGNMILEFNDFKNFKNFNDSVKMYHTIDSSFVNGKDLVYFSPTIQGFDESITFSGNIAGYVDNLKGKNIDFRWNDNTKFNGDIHFKHLHQKENIILSFNAKQLSSTYEDLIELPIYPFNRINNELKLPTIFESNNPYVFEGNIDIIQKDVFVEGRVKEKEMGMALLELGIENEDEKSTIIGNIKSKGLNIERVVGSDILQRNFGEYDLVFELPKAEDGNKSYSLKVKGNSDYQEFAGKKVKGVKIDVFIENDELTGRIKSKDRHIKFDFDGRLNFKKDSIGADALLSVKNFNPGYFGWVKDKSINLKGEFDVNSKNFDINNVLGKMVAHSIEVNKDEKTYLVDDLFFESIPIPEGRSIELNSSIGKMKMKGEFHLTELYSNLQRILKDIYSEFTTSIKQGVRENFSFEIETGKTDIVTALFSEDLKISPGAKITGDYNSKGNSFNFNMEKLSILNKDAKYKNIYLIAEKNEEKLSLECGADSLRFNKQLFLNELLIGFDTDQGKAKVNIDWYNSDDNFGDISFSGNVIDLFEYSVAFEKSKIIVGGKDWYINPNANVYIKPEEIEFDSLYVQSGKDFIGIQGYIASKDPDKMLQIDVNNYDLNQINYFLEGESKYSGIVNGQIVLNNIFENRVERELRNNLSIDSLKINQYNIGNVSFQGEWDTKDETYYMLGQVYNNKLKSVDFKGGYTPSLKDNIDIKLNLNNTDLGFLNIFLPPEIKDFKSTVFGDLKIKGSVTEPRFKGKFKTKDGGLKVRSLNTNYTFSGEVVLDDDLIYWNSMPVKDDEGNLANCYGTFYHHLFKEWDIDLFFETKVIKLMDNNRELSPMYYGKLYGSGNAAISGGSRGITIEGDIETQGGTRISIPLDRNDRLEQQNFIRFVSKKDKMDSTIVIAEKPVTETADFTMDLGIKLTPLAKVELIYDEKAGEKMQGRASGELKLKYDKKADFNIYGDILIASGDYLFSFQNVIKKKFEIEQGSSIRWNGDVYRGELNVKAAYRIKTSLKELAPVYDPNEDAVDPVYQKNEEVLCKLILKDKILQPDISFDIVFTNVNQIPEEVKTSLKAVTSTEQDMNLQFFSLLLFNKFWPRFSETSVSNDVLVNTTSELLSNQISAWLSSISEEVDFNVKYDPGTSTGNQEFQFGFETEVFDDRLVIKGTTGYAVNNGTSTTGQPENQVIGDFIVEYKISTDGNLRVKAFNLTNDYTQLSTTNNAQYTQGVGVFYREGFDKLGDIKFIDRYRKNKEKKKAYKEELKAREEKEKQEQKKED